MIRFIQWIVTTVLLTIIISLCAAIVGGGIWLVLLLFGFADSIGGLILILRWSVFIGLFLATIRWLYDQFDGWY